MPKTPSRPHDEFFKASFGQLEIALDYIHKMLPADLVEALDTSRLSKVSGSYISQALQEYFSDLVYECPFKNQELELQLSLLFEHKANPETYPHFQVLRYMLETWEEQLKQKKALTLIIPIIIYQGKENWNVRDLNEYFGTPIPQAFQRYLPHFDYHFTSVRGLPDEEILALGRSLLVNTFLLMKYIWEPDFILNNPRLVFMDLELLGSPPSFLRSMLEYLFKNSEFAEQKVERFFKELPKALNETAMSTYDMILEKGRKQVEALLAQERYRAEEERQKAEEERQKIDHIIYHLYTEMQLSLESIATLTGRDLSYIEALIAKRDME
jgi:predicted transposase/invertase (TIGR01784 family)